MEDVTNFLSNYVEYIEFIFVLSILIIQVFMFLNTRKKIKIYKNVIPSLDSFSMSQLTIDYEEITNQDPQTFLDNTEVYKLNTEGTDLIKVNIIECSEEIDLVFEKILISINTYLISNRNASSDFNLIKDIVERNSDALEEEINLTISVPLYLGLMGTMLGIIVGLFGMGDIFKEVDTVAAADSISPLLNGVKIAMIASFTGLMLTIVNSGGIFRGSRNRIESRKNDFYTFIQVNLLPVLNKDMGSTFESLQVNLSTFNRELRINLDGLSTIFDSNRETLTVQKETLDKIESLDVAKIAKYNIKVMKELQGSTDNIQLFNKYLSDINTFVANSNELALRSTEILNRTDDFKDIAQNIEGNISDNKKLMDFLSQHFTNLEDYKNFVDNSIADVGMSITDVFKELEKHIKNTTDQVSNFTVDEYELLKKTLSQSKSALNNLEYLQSIDKNITSYQEINTEHHNKVKEHYSEMNKTLKRSDSSLKTIKHNTFKHRSTIIVNKIKNFLGLGKKNDVN